MTSFNKIWLQFFRLCWSSAFDDVSYWWSSDALFFSSWL